MLISFVTETSIKSAFSTYLLRNYFDRFLDEYGYQPILACDIERRCRFISGLLVTGMTVGKGIDEKTLTRMEIRKLNALRKSVGDDIANRTFAEWLANKPGPSSIQVDRNADMIGQALQGLIDDGRLAIPRGGYILRRGRGRVIVERPT